MNFRCTFQCVRSFRCYDLCEARSGPDLWPLEANRSPPPFPGAHDLETGALEVISGHPPVKPEEPYITDSAPCGAQPRSAKKEWNSFKKTETVSGPSERPYLFGPGQELGFGGSRTWNEPVSGPLFPTGSEAAHPLWRRMWDQR